jgi:hypothetical protein
MLIPTDTSENGYLFHSDSKIAITDYRDRERQTDRERSSRKQKITF